MKYLNSYKVFESNSLGKYYIKGHYWPYELGYIWSPLLRTSSYYRDPSVVEIRDTNDGMTSGLVGEGLGSIFKEYLGVSDSKDICQFHPNSTDMKEFKFINKSLLEKKNYAIVESPDGRMLVKQLDKFDKDYLEVIKQVIGRDLTPEDFDKEGDSIISSWHVSVKFYETNGIKYLSESLGGTEGYIIKRDDIEKFLDMTKSFNYYRFSDKELQLIRVGDKKIKFLDINDLFIHSIDHGLVLEDFNQISANHIMIKFMKDDAVFTDDLISELDDNISRFERYSGLTFNTVDITRNTMRWINDSNKTWLLKDRPVYSYTGVEELKRVGVMDYDAHLRPHDIYLIFTIL